MEKGFELQETVRGFYEAQYAQDIETLQGVLEKIDTRELGGVINNLREELQETDDTYKEGVLKALELVQTLITLKNWDEVMGRYAKKDLVVLDEIAHRGEGLVTGDIHDAIVVAARAVGRLAEARFPEEVEEQFSKGGGGLMTPDEIEQAKERQNSKNIK